MISLSNMDLMLATAPDEPAEQWLERYADDGRWGFQEKVDGIRVLCADGRLVTRNGLDITGNFPEVEVPDGWWLDAEIAVLDADGRADFEATNRRAKGGQGGEAWLHVFDVLAIGGTLDLRDQSYLERYMDLFALRNRHDQVKVLPILAEPRERWAQITSGGGEGLVAKLLSGTYTAGRTKTVVKLKHRATSEVIVVGRTKGEGSRADTFGALKVALVDEASPTGFRAIGEVGSGFTGADLVDLMELLVAGRPFVIEVSHLGFTSKGKIRHGSFERIRHDVDVLSCRVGAP